MLSKQQILEAKDVRTETVAVPEWGGEVLVKTMSGTERDAYEVSLATGDKPGLPNLVDVRARLLVFTLVNEDGSRIFTLDEIGVLGAKSAAALDRLFDAARRLNGIGREIEVLAKN
jgi:hypothetical protein